MQRKAPSEVRYEAGDVVRLKAGGPPMVVRAVGADIAYCQWYADVALHEGTFLFSSLEDIGRQRRPAAQAPAEITAQHGSAP